MIEKKRADLQEELDALDKKGRWCQGLEEPEGRGDRREGNINKENRLQSVGSVVRVADAVPDAGKEGGEVRVVIKQEKVDKDRGEKELNENESESGSESESDADEDEEVVVERVVVLKKKGDGERGSEQTSAEDNVAEANPVRDVGVTDPAKGNDVTVETPSEET